MTTRLTFSTNHDDEQRIGFRTRDSESEDDCGNVAEVTSFEQVVAVQLERQASGGCTGLCRGDVAFCVAARLCGLK